MKVFHWCTIILALLMAWTSVASAEVLALPEELKTIEDEAFMNVESLDEVELPEGLESIGARAFKNSGLRSITLPTDIYSIGEDAFADCDDLTLYVHEGTYAHEYCINNDIPYELYHMLKITAISPLGATDGTVRGVLRPEYNPEDYCVMVYIYTPYGYYVKPTYREYYSNFNLDGSFKVCFVTNGSTEDAAANPIHVLVVPKKQLPKEAPEYSGAKAVSIDEVVITRSEPAVRYTELVFEDDFSGDAPDTTKWECQTGNGVDGWGNWEAEYYKPENATVSEGTLKLTAKNEIVKVGGRNLCTSARLHSKFSFTYGRVDVRARCDVADAIWPAIWLLPKSDSYGVWPRSGEIDIYEARGGLPGVWNAALHYPRKDNANYSTNAVRETSYGDGTMSDWHVYSVEWSRDAIIWRIDGDIAFIRSDWQTPNGAYPAPFDRDFFLILNLAVGGEFNRVLHGTNDYLPSTFAEGDRTFEIDYVRIYQ